MQHNPRHTPPALTGKLEDSANISLRVTPATPLVPPSEAEANKKGAKTQKPTFGESEQPEEEVDIPEAGTSLGGSKVRLALSGLRGLLSVWGGQDAEYPSPTGPVVHCISARGGPFEPVSATPSPPQI